MLRSVLRDTRGTPAVELSAAHLELLPHAAALARPSGDIEYANLALRELLNSSEAEVLARTVRELVHHEDILNLQRKWLRALAGAECIAPCVRVLAKGAGYKFVQIALTSLPSTPSGPRVLALITDIDTLQRSRTEVERLRVALEGSGQGAWDHDRVENTVYFSPNWYRMRGFEPGEDIDALFGRWFERLHPDDLPMIRDRTERQDSGELPANAFEYRERHRDGHWMWVLSRGKPVAWKPDGSVARIVGTDTDITALKTSEARLADEKDRLRVTLQAVADGIVSTDATGIITYMNPAASALLDWETGDAIGSHISEVYSIEAFNGDRELRHVVLRCLDARSVQTDAFEVVLHCRSGASFEVQHSASPLLSGEELVGAVLVFRDVRESAAVRRELAHAALHDPLTGLPNRSAFAVAIDEASRSAAVHGQEHALCYIDLDYFKVVNDRAGHSAGDEVLRRTAELLTRSCRASDFAGRIGGDEFVLLLKDCPVPVAQRACEKLIRAIASERYLFDGVEYQVGASIGIAPITRNLPSPSELTNRADTACYKSKTRGRGCVSVFEEQP